VLAKVDGGAEVLAFFRESARSPLGVRLHRLQRWIAPDSAPGESLPDSEVDGASSKRAAPNSVAVRHATERVIQRARRELLDVAAVWAEMLTDREALRAAFDAHAPGEMDDGDLRTALAWCTERCSAVLAELEAFRDEGGRSNEKKHRAKEKRNDGRQQEGDDVERAIDEERPAPKLIARRPSSESDDEDEEVDDDRSVGVDGALEAEPARLDREDDALLLRLVQRLRGPLVRGRERLRYEHIFIDEAQDLSPVELAVVMGTTNKTRSVTMAGDVAQRLHMDNGFKGWKHLLESIRPNRTGGSDEMDPIAIEPLRVQYRSTHPIIEFAQAVLGPLADPEGGHAIRDGAPVELFRFAHSGEAVAFLSEALRELMQAEPRASVALIARYPEQADLYYRGLVNAEVPNVRRIAEEDFPFKPGIDVTDVRQVKGLEFDYVVLLEVSTASYPVNDESRHLLHIAATRAAHQLWVTTHGEPSLLLPESLRNRAS
jgi:DNA helicase-2/ATP-dependent DNA helicase PcrA